jgi:predicted nucleic acid-binding protein
VTASIVRSCTGVRFVDTSVLLYAISRDPDEHEKAALANELIFAGDIGLSVQILQEFYAQATRESRTDRLPHEQAAALVDSFRRFPVQETSIGVMLAGMSTRERFGISYWDAAILEAARALGCEVVLSEDLSDGQDYGGVRVENPFG